LDRKVSGLLLADSDSGGLQIGAVPKYSRLAVVALGSQSSNTSNHGLFKPCISGRFYVSFCGGLLGVRMKTESCAILVSCPRAHVCFAAQIAMILRIHGKIPALFWFL
jgi:hypothetical protein